MKKLILCLAIAGFSSAAMAQVSFGLKAGANISTLRGDDIDGIKSLVGANGGLFASIFMSDLLSLQPEVLYSMEGAKEDGGDGKIKLGYINVPIMLRIKSPQGFYGEFGPQIGILASAKEESGGSSSNIKDELKTTNISVALGAGYDFSPAVGVNARYSLGMGTILKDSNDGDIKTGNFSIGLHYRFGQ